MIDIRIQEEDFNIEDEWNACRERMSGRGGAMVAFAGLVRDFHADDEVQSLYLEHYPDMTEKSIEGIVNKAIARWSLLDVVVIHRIGQLDAREQIVLVLVGSSHRPDAFAACECIMDFLKTKAAFWKKEIRKDSESWVRSTSDDYRRSKRWMSEQLK